MAVPDHHHQAESLESAKRLGSQASACMSSEHRSELLLAELRELRGELAQLSNRVLSLESQIQGSSFLSNPPITVNYSVAGASAFGTSNSPPGSPLPTSAAQTPVTSTGRHRASEYTEAERRTAAIEVGRFLRHALEEEHQGASSRDRIKLQSRVYILCKNISGRLYNPVKIFHSFAAIKPLVKVDGECGMCLWDYGVGGQSRSARCRPELACR